MKYAKLENNIVVQVQPYPGADFIEVNDNVFCGLQLVDGVFSVPAKTEDDIQQGKIFEAEDYLRNTDWIEPYILRHELNIEVLPESSSKWAIHNMREFYKRFLANL